MTVSEQHYWKRVLVTAAIYVAAAWAAVEAMLTVVDRFGLPAWWGTLIMALFVAGLPVTLFLVWRTAGAERHADAVSIIGSMLFLIVGTAGIFWFTQPPPQLEARTVAIVPCEFEGEDEHAYRADGLAEDVHARLSRVDAVKISSWNSSLFVRDKGYEPERIAEVLRVDRLVQCRMKSSPERIELSAELIDPVADTVLWNRDYDFAIADLGTVVTELAGSLLDVLGTRVEAAEMERVNDLGTFSPEAYDLYLQALTGVDDAEALLVKALKVDPNYPDALVLHARFYLRRAVSQEFEDMAEPRAWLEEMRSLSQRALELDPGVFGARSYLARVCSLTRQYYDEDCSPEEEDRLHGEECEVRGDTAEGWACWHRVLASRGEDDVEALKRWLELEPTSADANIQYMGELWAGKGRPDEALAVFDTMRALHPDDLRTYGLISNLLRNEGRLDEVLAWRYGVYADRIPENPWFLARLATDYMNLGLYQQALDFGLRTWETRRSSAMHFLPMLWVRLGEPERAAEALEWQVEVVGGESPRVLMFTASYYVHTLRNFEQARELYDEALANAELHELCEDSDDCVGWMALQMAHMERALGHDDEAAAWLKVAEEAVGTVSERKPGEPAAMLTLEAALRIAQGRHDEAVELLRAVVFAWETSQGDLQLPLIALEHSASFDPLRELPGFQQLLDDYDAHLEPMRQRVLEAERTGDWETLRQRIYQWAAGFADSENG